MAIYIDGDACPVKAEVYKVAARYDLKTFVVADAAIFVPTSLLIEMVVVKRGFDAAERERRFRFDYDASAAGAAR